MRTKSRSPSVLLDNPEFLLVLWEEGRAPNLVIEVTSQSTRDEDLEDKLEIYRDEIGVAEYFLFDPRSEYLSPTLPGHRLNGGQYEPIVPVDGRLPSVELGLQLEADGGRLRFYDPMGQRWLPTPQEVIEQKDVALEQKDAALEQKTAELGRLRQELAALRRQAK